MEKGSKSVIRILIALLFVLVLSSPLQAKRRKTQKFFPSTHESIDLENSVADIMGVPRIDNEQEMFALVNEGALVPLDGVEISRRLPVNRRYALPTTIDYIRGLNEIFYARFYENLVVTSAIRPATVQRRLRYRNRNAAPYDGTRASSHERGTTIDISRRMPRREYQWLVWKLLVDRAFGRVLVIEEKACLHLFVIGDRDTPFGVTSFGITPKSVGG